MRTGPAKMRFIERWCYFCNKTGSETGITGLIREENDRNIMQNFISVGNNKYLLTLAITFIMLHSDKKKLAL